MSRHNTMVFQNMRPPVAAEHGNTPLRGKNAKQIFALAEGGYEDRSGTRINKEQVVLNYTDDARLVDSVWNPRHHVTPAQFNKVSHTYYKVSQRDIYTMAQLANSLFCPLQQYFDKEHRVKDQINLQP